MTSLPQVHLTLLKSWPTALLSSDRLLNWPAKPPESRNLWSLGTRVRTACSIIFPVLYWVLRNRRYLMWRADACPKQTFTPRAIRSGCIAVICATQTAVPWRRTLTTSSLKTPTVPARSSWTTWQQMIPANTCALPPVRPAMQALWARSPYRVNNVTTRHTCGGTTECFEF